MYLFAENSLKENFSNERLTKLNYSLIKVSSLNKNPRGVCQLKPVTVVSHSQSQTGGLSKLFSFKKSSRVMLTTNISINDRLVNGQLRTVVHTKQDSSGIISKTYVKFEDENAGLTKMGSGRCISESSIIPFVRIEANISVSLNLGLTIHQT